MPTYEYKCTKCDHQFEVEQRMTEDPLSTCPECQGKVQRLISGGAGIAFRGSGFYVNDSKTPKKSENCQACHKQNCPGKN